MPDDICLTITPEAEGGDPWDKLVGEPERAHAAFCLFRDMGEGRSFRALRQAGFGSNSLTTWKRRWRWEERIREFDDEWRRKLQREGEKDRLEMARRQARLGTILQEQAEAGAILLDPAELGAGDIARLAEAGVKIERLARGATTDNDGFKGELRITVCDVT